MLKKLFLVLSLIISLNLLPADDRQILEEVSQIVERAKKELAKWDESKADDNLLNAIDLLKEAKKTFHQIEDESIENFEETQKELNMLYFWANKAKRIDLIKRKPKEFEEYKKTIEESKSETPGEALPPQPKEIDESNVEIPEEHPIIKNALTRAIEFSKSNPKQVYECEFMYRDIFYDFPSSKSAEIAQELANKYVSKIEVHDEKVNQTKKDIRSKILQHDDHYKNRRFDLIHNQLLAMKGKSKDRFTEEIIDNLSLEYHYLQLAKLSLEELFTLKKNDLPPASFIGVKFRGFVSASNDKGLVVKTDMGEMIVPWSKITDEHLAHTLSYLCKDLKVSHKIIFAIHLLGKSIEAFDLLYERSLESPMIMANHSHLYFQCLFHYRKGIKVWIQEEMQKAQKLKDNNDVAGAISYANSVLKRISKNHFMLDEKRNIQHQIKAFGN